MTLVELLVVMVLVGIVGTIMTSAFVSAARSTTAASGRVDALDDLRPAIQRIQRELRAADPLVLSASSDYETELGVVVTRNGATSQHDFYLTGTPGDWDIWEDQYDVAADGTPTLRRSSSLVAHVENDASTPVFTYYDDDGQRITCDDLDLTIAADVSTCRDRHLTASRVRFEIVRAIDGQSPIVLETQVAIRNSRYG